MKRALLVVVLLCLSVMPLSAQDNPATGGHPWDLKDTDQQGEFVFYDLPAGASTTGKPLDMGDFDGNGCGDIAITGQNSSHPLGVWRGSVGHVRVLMNVCKIEGQLSVDQTISGQNFFTIFGAYAGDMAGTETYVGDFNADGYDDLLFTAQNSDGADLYHSNAGAAYVLFGSPNFASHTDIDLLQLPHDVMVIYGADVEDRLGIWVEGGDFDGDGFHDLLIGADQADGIDNIRSNAGEAWIIYGAADMMGKYGQITSLDNPPPDATRIIGADYSDLLGACVWGDDFDADGIDDVVVSAGLWRASSGVGGLSFGGGDGPSNTRYNAGESFVVFGRADLRGQTIDLAAMLDTTGAPLDERVTVVYGVYPNDLLGEEIAAGDMDGDGRNDLILGTLIGDGAERDLDEAGEAWIIYTHDPFRGLMIDLADVDPTRAVVIYPDQADGKAGDTLRAGDLDKDGVADLFYGAPDYDPIGYDGQLRPNAGLMAVIFGEKGGIPNENGRILLFDPPPGLRVKFIIGGDDNDMMPYAMALGDLDGDGVLDILPNAMGGDGANNDQINAGEIYAISGAEFLLASHVYQGTPSTVVTAPPPTAFPTNTPVGDAPLAISTTGDWERGKGYYEETCAGCHGFDGEGIQGLGLRLVDSPLVMYASDLELIMFLRVGRSADHPDNTLGVSMPPSGGRPDWSNEIFMDIIAYLRYLRDQAQ
ncbi:MAG: cytochrome c [Chloroflexi bacterium]|nr:cytochrome c [Chloroflexota bacterium]